MLYSAPPGWVYATVSIVRKSSRLLEVFGTDQPDSASETASKEDTYESIEAFWDSICACIEDAQKSNPGVPIDERKIISKNCLIQLENAIIRYSSAQTHWLKHCSLDIFNKLLLSQKLCNKDHEKYSQLIRELRSSCGLDEETQRVEFLEKNEPHWYEKNRVLGWLLRTKLGRFIAGQFRADDTLLTYAEAYYVSFRSTLSKEVKLQTKRMIEIIESNLEFDYAWLFSLQDDELEKKLFELNDALFYQFDQIEDCFDHILEDIDKHISNLFNSFSIRTSSKNFIAAKHAVIIAAISIVLSSVFNVVFSFQKSSETTSEFLDNRTTEIQSQVDENHALLSELKTGNAVAVEYAQSAKKGIDETKKTIRSLQDFSKSRHHQSMEKMQAIESQLMDLKKNEILANPSNEVE